MARRIMTAAAAAAAVVTLGACARGDDTTYDTMGAMATPPAIGLSVGATTGMTTGATTLTRDTLSDTARRYP